MGYYTEHTLEILEGDEGEIIADLLLHCVEAGFSINSEGESEGKTKWYSHKEDLLKFSEVYPNALFKLSGIGEESGDIWAEYYKNGKSQLCTAEIVIPDFNPKHLK